MWPALVIGTFAPDLQYFILISDEDRSGHRFPEVLLFTIPLALLVLWIFESMVKRPAIELLPSGLQRRLQDKQEPLSFAGWNRFAAIVLWTTVGVATHVAWDQFTHGYSWLASRWTLLQTTLHLPLVHPITVAHLLQHISTVSGILVLGAWFAAWYHRTPLMPQTQAEEFSPLLKTAVVLTMGTIAALAGYPIAMWRLAHHPPPIKLVFVVVTTFVASTMVFCIQLLLYAVAITLSARARHSPATQPD